MKRLVGVFVGIALLSLLLGPALRAEDAASPDADAIKEKGLGKQGNIYVLAAEAELATGMKDLRGLKHKVDEDSTKRRKFEDQVKMAKGMIAQLEFEHRRLNEQYLKEQDPTIHNQIVAKMNIITSRMNEAIEYKNTSEGKLHGAGEETRTKYVNQLIDLAAKAEEAEKKYEELAADEDLKGAIEKVNATAKPKMKLGPSADFKQSYNALKRLRADVNSDIVTVTMENHIPMVEVTLNGKITRTMILDSGASTVAVPADLAKELELVPGPNDPTIRLQLADGKIVEGKQMMLKSVRVGTFTIENVECAVLPESLIAAQPLLGGSFLNNFTYRLDAEAGQLHLAQVGGTAAKPGEKPEKVEKKPGEKAAPAEKPDMKK